MRISDWSSDVCSSELDRWRQIAVAASAVQHHTALFEGTDADARSGAALEELGNLPDIGIDAVKEIGRASCRERVCQYVYISRVAVPLKKKKTNNKQTESYTIQ